MTGALERVRLLRTALQQAALAATIPGAGIIITPALGRTLQRSQEVLLIRLQASMPTNLLQDSIPWHGIVYKLTNLRNIDIDSTLLTSQSQILQPVVKYGNEAKLYPIQLLHTVSSLQFAGRVCLAIQGRPLSEHLAIACRPWQRLAWICLQQM